MTLTPSRRLLWFVALCFIPICALPAVLSQGPRLVGLGSLALAFVAGFDAFLSRRLLMNLRVVLPDEIRATLNQQSSVRVELHLAANVKASPKHVRLAVAFPPEVDSIRDDIWVPAPEAGRGLSAELTFLGRERGRFPIQRTFVGTDSKFGLWQLRRELPARSHVLLQLPLSEIYQKTAKLLANRLQGSRRIHARSGRGREFEQLRDYVPSDDISDIDWKATARRRHPIVRDYQVERTQDIYACIDYSRLSGRNVTNEHGQRVTVLDEYIRSALMLYCAVRETGDRFGLATFNNQVGSFMKATNAASLEHLFRGALYPLQSQMVAPAYDEICSAIRNRVRRRALLIFFTNLAEPQLAEAFLAASRLLVRQHLVVVACPIDSFARPLFSPQSVQNVDEIYDKLSGHLLWKKMAEVRSQLSGLGIRMHTVSPGRLGLVAATEYLQIKEKQLL